MPKEYTQEQRWELYKKLPKEIKEILSSPETAETMDEICERFEISGEKASVLVNLVGQVLLGVLPPEEFKKTIKKELKLNKDLVEKLVREINRFIFYPVKSSLEEIYKLPIAPPAIPKAAPPKTEKPKEMPRKDIYREPIE